MKHPATMKALVLCAGKGTRLRPITHTGAKHLLPIANKPILFYVLDNIVDIGIREIGLVISPDTGDAIRHAVGDGARWNASVSYIIQERPRGLGDAVKAATDFLADSPFLMYLGDNLIGTGLRGFCEKFVQSDADAQILIKPVDNPSSFGIATLDETGRVIALEEKPKNPQSNQAIVGVYLFSPEIHRSIAGIKPSWRGEYEITDAIQDLLNRERRVLGDVIEEWWLDTGKKDDLLQANAVVLDEWIERKVQGAVDPASSVLGRVVVPESARVINSRLRGPAVLGEGVLIENSFVGPFTSIGDHSRICDSAVEHCVILERCQIVNLERLEDSLLGKNSKVIRNNRNPHGGLRLMVGDDSVVEI
ncbi:MAG: glucose-1-phosphate thymidyltransferase [Deltaproteobacteria bacterium]|nr:glucose-1-phosphate thymidyltransferase [Deltaproteobacteria bacterium]